MGNGSAGAERRRRAKVDRMPNGTLPDRHERAGASVRDVELANNDRIDQRHETFDVYPVPGGTPAKNHPDTIVSLQHRDGCFQNADNSNLPFTPTVVQLGPVRGSLPLGNDRMVSITIRNLTKRFGDVVALKQLNLEIRKGELFFLLGPSGCGKTTLLRTIAGFYHPDEGDLYFDSDDVTRRPPHRRNTAMVFQSYALWPHMNVFQNVSFGLQQKRLPAGVIEGRVNKALRTVQMDPYASRKINQLSGGQQQRVALARALVVEPACLLLDEPLSNLDAQLRLEMRSEIRRICKEAGLTTIYVTHDQKEALSIADRMAILENGDFAQIGTPQEIYRDPVSRSVATFIGESNFLAGRIIEPAKRLGYWSVETNAGTFEGRITDANWKPQYNDRVSLAIRPECFHMVAEKPHTNFVQGKIIRSAYLGELAQYWLDVDGLSAPVQISCLNPRQIESAGDKVYFAETRSEDVIILNN